MKKIKRLLFVKMARKLSKSSTGAPVPTIISETSNVKGDIMSDGMIHIDGQVEGDISCEELVIGTKGVVIGSVNTRNLQLYGSLNGKASADNLFIAKTAKLVGDAFHCTIAIEPGAYIDGHCVRQGDPIPAEQGEKEYMIADKRKKDK